MAFLRLLLHQPSLAFLDEATGALDIATEALIYSSLQQRNLSYISVGRTLAHMGMHSGFCWTSLLQNRGDSFAPMRQIDLQGIERSCAHSIPTCSSIKAGGNGGFALWQNMLGNEKLQLIVLACALTFSLVCCYSAARSANLLVA